MDTVKTLLLIYLSGVAAYFIGYIILIFPLGMINARVSGRYYFGRKCLEAKGGKYSLWKDFAEYLNDINFVCWFSWLGFCFIVPAELFATVHLYFKIKRTSTDRLRQIVGVLAFTNTDRYSLDASVCAAIIAYKLEIVAIRLDPAIIASEIKNMVKDMPSFSNTIDSKDILGYLKNFFPELSKSFYLECDQHLENNINNDV